MCVCVCVCGREGLILTGKKEGREWEVGVVEDHGVTEKTNAETALCSARRHRGQLGGATSERQLGASWHTLSEAH